MNRYATHRSIAVLLLLSLLTPPLAVAAVEDDERVLASYQLTTANVGKVKTALDEISRLKYEAPAKDDDESFDSAIRKLEKHPEMMRILRSAGISAKDFVMTLTTVITVGTAMAITEDTSGEILPPYLRAHRKFMVENEKVVGPLLESLFGDDE